VVGLTRRCSLVKHWARFVYGGSRKRQQVLPCQRESTDEAAEAAPLERLPTLVKYQGSQHCAGGSCVVSSKEYREFVDECLGWAKTARSDQERRIFLQMAETWATAAELAERREGQPAGSTAHDTIGDRDAAEDMTRKRPDD
jgi:hypothetical protein